MVAMDFMSSVGTPKTIHLAVDSQDEVENEPRKEPRTYQRSQQKPEADRNLL
jgi:hypothetical protein